MNRLFFIADAHIHSNKSQSYHDLLDFIDYFAEQGGTHLIIVGDLFEFLYGNDKYVIKVYNRLFEKLKKLTDKGVEIYYLYGNHDFNFSFPSVSIKTEAQLSEFNFNNRKIMFYHGDGIDPHDWKYRLLKAVLRGRLFKTVSKLMPASFLYGIAGFFSFLSRKQNADKMERKRRYLHYRDHALKVLKETDTEIVILAHTHIAELVKVNDPNGTKYYANPGFFGKDRSYGIIDDADGVYIGVFNKRC